MKTLLGIVAVGFSFIGVLFASGDLDARFGAGGVVVTATAAGDAADFQAGLAVQADGKIVVGGESDMGEAGGGFQWRVSRYTRDGELDVTFGGGGTVLTSMVDTGGFDERIVSLAVQHDRQIVAAGVVQIGPDSTQDGPALVRYNADGSLDDTFGEGGRVRLDVAPGHDFVTQVLIDDAGRILVGGGCRHSFVARYTRDGELDPSFNANGALPGLLITEIAPSVENNSDEFLAMAIDASGRIVAAGYANVFDGTAQRIDSVVVRFQPDGTLDPTFNPDGPRPGVVITRVAPGLHWDVAFSVAIDVHGRTLTAGDAFVGIGAGGYDAALARYLPDGRLDRTFGGDGIVLTNLGPGDSDDDVRAVRLQANGKILAGGSAAPTFFLFDSDFAVARYNRDGSLDPTFGNGGISRMPTGANGGDDEIWAMTLQGGAHVIASGECDQALTGRDVCLVRFGISDPND